MLYPLKILRTLFPLALGLVLAAALAWWIVRRNYSPADELNLLVYNVPIVVPFAAFVFDRLIRRREIAYWQWGLDALVIGLALARARWPLPLISGHALFLSYAMLSSRSWVTRLVAGAVLVEVAYLKLVWWGDLTVIGGVVLGASAAWLRNLQPGRILES